MRAPVHGKAQVLARRVVALAEDAQVAGLVVAHGRQAQVAVHRDLGHLLAAVAVDVDDGGVARLEDAVEQQRLGREVFVEALVIVEMVLAEVREGPRAHPHPVQPALVQAVGRRLHRGVGDARRRRFGQHAVQRHRLGRGVGELGGMVALDPHRAETDRLVPERLPDLAGEGRDRGLAGRAGDGDDRFGLGREPQRGGPGERGARVLGHHHGGAGRGKLGGGDLRAAAVGQDRSGALAQGIPDELAPVGGRSGQRGEQVAVPHGAAVDRKAGDGRVAPVPCPQTQRGQKLAVTRHRHPSPRPFGPHARPFAGPSPLQLVATFRSAGVRFSITGRSASA